MLTSSEAGPATRRGGPVGSALVLFIFFTAQIENRMSNVYGSNDLQAGSPLNVVEGLLEEEVRADDGQSNIVGLSITASPRI